MKISFSAAETTPDVLVIPVFNDNTPAVSLSTSLKHFVMTVLEDEDFNGDNGEVLTLHGSSSAKKVIILGIGNKNDLNENSVRQLGAPLYEALKAEGGKATLKTEGVFTPALNATLADALLRESYEFKKYKTDKNKTPETEINFLASAPQQSEKKFNALRQTTDSVFWASDLANEPANVLNPETYAAKIQAELAPLGIKVSILNQQDMEKLGMGAALAVGKGSIIPPCMVVMEYDGSAGQQERPLALVGKGITFDTGGISIKPGANMGDMTLDMGGSAAVVGAMRALASNHTKSNVVAIVALAENMPDGNAYRPGDILTSLSGKTIYVGNTDAEGRLVLADAMTYIQRTFNPHTVVDLATLTGAAVGALGTEFAAVYANDNKLWKKFNAASRACGEKIWRMPLTETKKFTQAVRNTPLADLTNLASGPGSCTAAAFLHEFIEKDDKGNDKCKWVHIDMAGPGIPGTIKKGWGVLLLNQLIHDHYKNSPAPKQPAAPAKNTGWGLINRLLPKQEQKKPRRPKGP